MSTRKSTVLLLFILIVLSARSQDSLYTLISKGSLPSWVNRSPEKQLSIAYTEKQTEGYKLSGAMKDILKAATELQYSYLRSGQLLFNDDLSVLSNTIALKLLKGNFALRHSLKICVAFTNTNNITVCPNGLMILDLGLFAQLENEHQLAFLISHELAHLKNGDLTTSEAPTNFSTITPDLRNYIDYKRERERLADSLGYEMYKEAGYSPGQALRVFDVLDRNWLVPSALPFKRSVFTTPDFTYSDSIFVALDSCSLGVDESEYFNSTQIEYSQRKSYLATVFKIANAENQYQQPSAEFEHINQLAIYNSGLYALQSYQIPAAFYLGYYLHEKCPSVRDEADLLIGKAIYVQSALNCTEHEGYTTTFESKSDHHEYFENISTKPEKPERDERGYIAGAGLFLDGLSPKEMTVLSIRWNWDYAQRSQRHKQIALELAGYSVNMLNIVKAVPFYELDSIKIEKTVRVPRPADDEAERDEELDSRDNRTEMKIDEIVRRAQHVGIDVSSQADSLRNITFKRRKYNYGYYKVQVVNYITQLKSLKQDQEFMNFYSLNAPESASNSLLAIEYPPFPKGDSIYLFDVSCYYFQQKPAMDHFDFNYAKSESKTRDARDDTYKAGKGSNIAVVFPGIGGSDSMSTTEYNAFCLASRIKDEITWYSGERFTYPLAYKEDYKSLNSSVKIRYYMSDFSLIRHLSNAVDYSYRETAAYDLVTGQKVWVALGMEKGVIEGGPHLRRFFQLITRKP